MFLRFPREVKGVYWNTVTTEAWSRIKWHEAKWLGGSCVDYFPDINSHCPINNFKFIHERNIDGAENIFSDFNRLSYSWIRNRHHSAYYGTIETFYQRFGLRAITRYYFWYRCCFKFSIARIFALRVRSQERGSPRPI